MTIRILAEARSDIVEAFIFYEDVQTGLGTYFIESIFADIDTLAYTAGIHPDYSGKFRKIASKFPYSIFYLINDDLISIHAVIDNRRDPQLVSKRLN